VPFALDLRVAQGGSKVDLGGLWLERADVTMTQGGGELDFSQPLRHPLETLAISSSMGGGTFQHLGNASPQHLKVESQMGGSQVDLRGRWLRDCEISLESRMGGMEVRLPEDVSLRGLAHRREAAGESAERRGVPVLSFRVSNAMGEVQFKD
jgi:hypothetical protein